MILNKPLNTHIFLAFLSKGMAMILNIYISAFVYKNYSSDVVAQWLILSSLLLYASILDFGVINAFKNHGTQIFNDVSLDKFNSISKKYILDFSTRTLISIVAVSVGIYFFKFDLFFDEDYQSHKGLIIVLGSSLIFEILNRALISYNEVKLDHSKGFIANIISYTLILLVFVLDSSFLSEHGITVLLLFQFLIKNLLLFLLLLYFNRDMVWSNVLNIDSPNLPSKMKFLLLQIMYIFMYQFVLILINDKYGESEVSEYGYLNKLFNYLYTVLLVFTAPFWTHIRTAYVNRNSDLLLSFVNRIKLSTFFAVISVAMLYIFSSYILQIWLGDNVISAGNTLAVAFLFVVMIINHRWVVFLNAFDSVRIQIISALLGCLIIVASFLLDIKMTTFIYALVLSNIPGLFLYRREYNRIMLK